MKKFDLLGQKINSLLVIREVIDPQLKGKHTRWECLCDCGNLHITQGRQLKSQKAVHCFECKGKQLRKPAGEATFHNIFCMYRAGAKKRKIEFDLLESDFRTLINGNCYYCNCLPSQISKPSMSSRNSAQWIKDSTVKWNGIDRIDSNLGYEINNCVTCCKWCNQMKMETNIEVFFRKVNLIYNKHLRNKNEKK